MAEKSQCGANTYPAGTDWHGNSHTTHEMNQRCYLVTWDTSSNSADVFLSVRWYPFFSGLVRAHVTPPRFGPKFWQLWAFGPSSMVYLIVAGVVGFVAESILGWRLPLGIVGTIIAALLGAWILTKVLIITGIGD